MNERENNVSVPESEMNAISELEKDINHHIRNPLQAISVLLAGVVLQNGADPEVAPYIMRIRKQLDDLTLYMNSLPSKFKDLKSRLGSDD